MSQRGLSTIRHDEKISNHEKKSNDNNCIKYSIKYE